MDEASDAGAHGGAPREQQATIYDDPSLERFTIRIPFEASRCTHCAQKGGGGYMATDLNNMVRHHDTIHSDVPLIFLCSKCNKNYKGKLSALSHFPKCPGPKASQGDFICELCSANFATKSGLSQHLRHAHPEAANKARAAKAQRSGRTAVPRAGKVFSSVDIMKMAALEKEQPETSNENLAALLGKTARQVGEKRKDITYRRYLAAIGAESTVTAESSSPSDGRRSDDSARPSTSAAVIASSSRVISPPKTPVSQIPMLISSSPLYRRPNLKAGREPVIPCSDTCPKGAETSLQVEIRKQPYTDSLPKTRPTGNGPEEHAMVDIASPEADRSPNEEAAIVSEMNQELSAVPVLFDSVLSAIDTARSETAGRLGRDQTFIGSPAAMTPGDVTTETCLNRATPDAKPNWKENISTWIGTWGISQTNVDQELFEVGNELKRNIQSQDQLNVTYAKLVEILGGSSAPTTTTNPKRPRRHGGKRARKRYSYARAQDLFKNDPALLAKCIRTGIDCTSIDQQPLNRDEVNDLYKSIWGNTPPIRLSELREGDKLSTPEMDPDKILYAVQVAEIKSRLAGMKNATAPGPDKIKVSHISSGAKIEILSLLYTQILYSGFVPSEWKANRTILIPKEGKDSKFVTNYRPITISSLLCRIFWGIMDKRIRSVVKFNPRQKGFIPEPGCFANVQILHEAVCDMKKAEGGVGAVLDISKAFDTVPHAAIRWALSRKGIPDAFTNLVMDSYADVSTIIQHPSKGIEVPIRRGVKQGDPLSPLLFNLIMECLLEKLENMSGYTLLERSVSVLAFADDLVLLAKDAPGAQELVDIVVEYLGALGMTLSVAKCSSFQITTFERSWFIEDPCLERLGERIPLVSNDHTLTYLGVNYSIWNGFPCKASISNLMEAVTRLRKVHLKPTQKLALLHTYIMPHYLYQLVLSMPSISMLREADCQIRVAVKQFLHLHMSTADGLFYLAKRDGGLGLLRLAQQVPRVALNLGLRLEKSADPICRWLRSCPSFYQRTLKTARTLRLNWPYTEQDLRAYKKKCADDEVAAWEKLGSQGRAVKAHINDPIGNAFLKDYNLLKPGLFITALQLRSNTAANKTTLSRGRPREDVYCRKCNTAVETMNHILGQCIFTKPARIKRHDEIKNFIEGKMLRKSDTVVSTEATFSVAEGVRLKPDLVIKSREGVHVVDVTVRHEDGSGLLKAGEEKVVKYQPVIPLAAQLHGVPNARILPVVVGTSGAVPRSTVSALKSLGITSRGDLLTISLIALRSSIKIYTQFVNYDGAI